MPIAEFGQVAQKVADMRATIYAMESVQRLTNGVLDDLGADIGWESSVVAGTFSKFAGSIGGFAAADRDTIEIMRHAASPFVFSASLPAALVAGVLAAFDLLEEQPDLRTRLWDNVHHLTHGLKDLGFDLGRSETPVIPVMLRDPELTMAFNRRLLDAGIYASPVIHPGVPPKLSRVRLGVMATHTREHLDQALEVFARVGRALGVLAS